MSITLVSMCMTCTCLPNTSECVYCPVASFRNGESQLWHINVQLLRKKV